jgi:hypothetical protein
MRDYSSKQISTKLLNEIVEALKNIRGWGSVEIFVQDHKVVQIVERNIKKTNDQVHSSAKQ